MDRSFLSDHAVIEASRRFVCARLSTYESAEEARFLESVFVGRSGKLENTVFAILDADGKTPLIRSGRGPHQFRSPSDLATRMREIADERKNAKTELTSEILPYVSDVRLALNVAACDRLPLVVVYGEENDALRSKLAELVWGEEYRGRFVMVQATEAKELAKIKGVEDAKPGVIVVAPGSFGLTGKAISTAPADADTKALQSTLNSTLSYQRPAPRNTREHIRAGRAQGVEWETQIPVTDPGIPPGGHRGPPPPSGRRGPRGPRPPWPPHGGAGDHSSPPPPPHHGGGDSFDPSERPPHGEKHGVAEKHDEPQERNDR